MKRILLVLLVLTAVLSLNAQTYPLIPIRDLQYVHPDSLARGNDKSPRVGDTVRVLGVCMVRSVVHPDSNRKVIMWAGARWQSYFCDTNYNAIDWCGINLIQDDTTTASSSLIDRLDTAKIYTITGIVSEFQRQTQINVLKTVPFQNRGTKGFRRQPIEVSISDFATGTAPNLVGGEKYEGAYVVIKNVLTSDRNTSTSAANPFSIFDENGNKIYVHGQSAYFTKRTYQVRVWDPPSDGSFLKMIRGIMGQNTDGSWVIRPLYPDDVVLGQSAPVASSLKRDKVQAAPGQPVTVTAKIVDYNTGGTVDSARIYYHFNGGAIKNVTMTKTNDTLWTGIIPGTTGDSTLVDYFVWAKNNTGLAGTSPSDTARNKWFYYSMNRTDLKIKDIQYSPFGGGYSAFNNSSVTVSGIVTADVFDLPGDGGSIARRAYIQDASGSWSGIQLNGAAIDLLHRGENITVIGNVSRTNSNNRIDSVVVVVNSSGNQLPAPVVISTSEIAASQVGAVSAQKWEGVFVRYNTVRVTRENADGNPGPDTTGSRNFGEMVVTDASNIETRVELQEGNHKYHNNWLRGLDTVATNQRIKTNDSFDALIGVAYYSFSNYKIVPRIDADFVNYHPTGISIGNKLRPEGIELSQNYPNPFNPATFINYTIPQTGKVSLKVFNVLGQELRTLVDMDQSAGTYKVYFDASSLPSGIYLYRIQAGSYFEVKKMTLLK